MEPWNTRAFFEAVAVSDVARCLQSGADLAARGASSWTPLHYAASVGNPEVVTVLLEAGADLEACAEDGLTPLHAASVGNPKAVTVLLEAGADPNAQTEDGRSPLKTYGDVIPRAACDVGPDPRGCRGTAGIRCGPERTNRRRLYPAALSVGRDP